MQKSLPILVLKIIKYLSAPARRQAGTDRLDKILKKGLVPIIPLTGIIKMANYSTKEFLRKIGVSESTLRRWLSENRIPQLNNVKRDWKGWRIWQDEHVEAVLEYKNRKWLSFKKKGEK